MASFGSVVSKQHDLFQRIARAHENAKKLGKDRLSRHALEVRIKSLDSNWERFQDDHGKLVAARSDDVQGHPYFADDLFADCEEAYFANKASILTMRDDLFGSDDARDVKSAGGPTAAAKGYGSRALPKISLPRFSGKYVEWPSFRDLFHSMVGGNPDVAAVEKMHYLKMHLADEAAQLISSIAVTSGNFERAWDMLTARYDNKRLLATSYLDQLFTLSPLTSRSADGLKSLIATVRDSLGALRALDVPVDTWDVFLVYFVARRLDATSLEEWEMQRGASTELASFAELDAFLEGRIRALEMMGARVEDRSPVAAAGRVKSGTKVAAKANAATSKAVSCAFCGSSHFVASCAGFVAKTPEQRREIVVAKHLCFNCLGAHKFSECRTSKRCRVCSGQHHTLIHRDGVTPVLPVVPAASGSPTPASVAPSSSSAVALSASADPRDLPGVLLATARVRVGAAGGGTVEVRALLDQGSEISFISESLVQGLRLPRRRAAVSVLGMGATSVGSTRGVVSVRLLSRVEPGCALDVSAYVLPRLTSAVPSRSWVGAPWPHLVGLPLADPEFAQSGGVDLVLGVGVYASVLRRDVRRGADCEPIAQETSLGWVVSGPTGGPPPTASIPVSRSFTGRGDADLRAMVERFWTQEEVTSPRGGQMSPDEEQCERHFRATASRDASGRYTVRLPFRNSTAPPSGLEESRSSAFRMLRRMQQRFDRDRDFGQLYDAFLREYESLGHMSAAPSVEGSVFLPHHGVLRQSSVTTKLRVVFNGSWRAASGATLNAQLHIGPRLQQDLAEVIMRWRRYKFVFLADVEKMYRQILVHPDDRDFQRILWSASGPPVEYRLNTVTYGLSCAPYLALRVLRQLAEDDGRRYPTAVDVVRHEMYVDDVLSGADSVELACVKAREIDLLLAAGGFRLGKWTTNAEGVLASIEPSRCGAPSSWDMPDDVTRALGLSWLPSADAFTFRYQLGGARSPSTKRSILSRTARLFDPLGWIAPVVVSAKILLQGLWSLDLGWDDELPPAISAQWGRFERELPRVAEYQLPRWIGLSASNRAVELHGFSDASQAALGAVLYLRVLDGTCEDARVTLLCAKTRVAPLKRQTVPRLELSAALLLAQLAARVASTLDLADAPLHLWVDSSVALAWIRGDPSRWKDYVANRVGAIRESVPRARWHHVAGVENPADCASRGLMPSELESFPVWWRGPEWLRRPSVSWPSAGPPVACGADLEERAPVAALSAAAVEADLGVWDLVRRFSDLGRLLRVTAWLRRALSKFRRVVADSPSGSLLPSEVADAEEFWVRVTQRAHFSEVIEDLKRGAALPRTHPLLRLSPFVDGDGVLRVGGRLRHSELEFDGKHPAVLPRDAVFSGLLIRAAHLRLLHGGVQLTLATLRRRYWVVGGRAAVGAAIRRCVRCARYRAATAREMMGQLPKSRVTPSRPFLHSGVDYAGPFELKTWRGRAARTYKGFLVVFVCFATSAVHLEMATDYSTQGFLAAFRRFTSRRGICSSLTSDCGTNFVGADAELRRLFSASARELGELRHVLASDGTDWRFNPPAAPHFGGKWEAAVKSVKFHLRRIIGDARLTYEEYCTLLAQVEAVLNSRPLCAVSDDPDDLEALTPGHFLVGGPLAMPPHPSLEDVPVARLSRWQLTRQMLERFWRRWSGEYLQRLQEISKWRRPQRQISVGSVVLVTDERYPPAKWPLARVVETHPGSDGLVRVVTVRTAATTLKRPVVKLCPLPVASDE